MSNIWPAGQTWPAKSEEVETKHELMRMLTSAFVTYVYFHSAGVGADVGAGESQRLLAHLTQASDERVVRDSHAHQLGEREDC